MTQKTRQTSRRELMGVSFQEAKKREEALEDFNGFRRWHMLGLHNKDSEVHVSFTDINQFVPPTIGGVLRFGSPIQVR